MVLWFSLGFELEVNVRIVGLCDWLVMNFFFFLACVFCSKRDLVYFLMMWSCFKKIARKNHGRRTRTSVGQLCSLGHVSSQDVAIGQSLDPWTWLSIEKTGYRYFSTTWSMNYRRGWLMARIPHVANNLVKYPLTFKKLMMILKFSFKLRENIIDHQYWIRRVQAKKLMCPSQLPRLSSFWISRGPGVKKIICSFSS